MRRSIGIDLREINQVISPSFRPRLTDRSRYFVEVGGAGSGKSHFLAQKHLLRVAYSMEAGVRQKFFCFRKTIPAARKSLFPLFKHYLAEWDFKRLIESINQTEMVFRFLDGSEIICTGLDDPEKIKSTEGMTSEWFEEANEFKEEDFIQGDLRLRGRVNTYFQISVSLNPVSRLIWPYTKFFENPLKGTSSHHSTVDDNPFIDEGYIEVLDGLADQDKVLYDVYRRGEWGVLKGLIFTNWDMVDALPEHFDDRFWSEDYGFNNPSCLGEIRIRDNEIYVRELIYERKLTNPQLTERVIQELPRGGPTKIIYADSEDPARIAEQNRILKPHNVVVIPCEKGRNSVKDGIDFLKRFKIHITKDSVNGIKEFQGYKWRELNKEGNDPEEPVKFNDHFCDMLRQGVYTHMGGARRIYTQEDFYNAYY